MDVFEIAKQIKNPDPVSIIKAGLKGTGRTIQYVKAHNGKSHPFSLIFGPLGGLMIPEDQLTPEKPKVMSMPRKVLPQNPLTGPPLPQGFDWHWPWSK